MKKRLLALLLSAAMLLSLTGAVAENADMPTITMWAGMSSNCPEETLHQGTIRDLLGINYTVEWTQGDFLTTLNMKINAGELPDICVFWNDTVAANALINSGLVQPVDAFVSDPEKYPNLAAIPAETLDYIRASSPDGKLWYLPGNYAIEVDDPWPGWTVDAWWVRKDLLAEAGMTLDELGTLEGFEKFARACFGKVTADGLLVQPISYSSEVGYNIILNAFGIDTGAGKSGMPAVSLVDNEVVFLYDHPNLKSAFAWMNKMYREGLMDMEVTTQKNERLTEKMNSGEIAIYPGNAWAPGLNNAWYAMQTEEDNIAAANLEPVKVPLAEGVTAAGKISYVNPYNNAMVFISKDCKNLDAVLTYLDWCNRQDPITQQEVNEGPEGVYWYWVDEPYGEWDFVPEYKAKRDSGDQALVDSCTTQMYYLSNYSREWYPWWTQRVTSQNPFAARLNECCQLISSSFGTTRAMHVYDAVPMLAGGKLERYLPSLQAVADEYGARLIMAGSDGDFDSVWTEFQSQLESRGHWSEVKQEWQEQYQAYVATNGEW